MATAYYSIDHTKIDSALTDFPVGIKINASTGFMSGLGANDWPYLHATVGGVECYVEVEYWDVTEDEAVLWVKVPSISSSTDTVIKIETGTLNTSYIGETGDTAAQNVWDENFIAVYHLAQDPSAGADCVLDSTSNGNNGTSAGSMNSGDLVDGDFGRALEFDGSDDYVNVGDLTDIEGGSALTIESNVNPTTLTPDAAILRKWYSSGQCFFYGVCKTAEASSLQRHRLGVNDDSQSNLLVGLTDADNFYVDTWTYLAGLWTSGSTISLFSDGDQKGVTYTESSTVSTLASVSEPATIAARYNGGSPDLFYSGLISELRVSDIVRSAAWIKATYNVLNNSLLTYSATNPSGGIVDTGPFSIYSNIYGSELFAIAAGPFPVTDGLSPAITYELETPSYIVAGPFSLGQSMPVVVWFTQSVWPTINQSLAVYRYHARITGTADGLSDYALTGLRSFQLRMRSGLPSFLSLVLPYTQEAYAAIKARANGEIVVDMEAIVGIDSLQEEFVRVNYDSVRYDLGAKSRTMTLTGYKTTTFDPGSTALHTVSMESLQADGTIKLKCHQPYFSIKPGQTVIHGTTEIIADLVSCVVGPGYQYMEVTG